MKFQSFSTGVKMKQTGNKLLRRTNVQNYNLDAFKNGWISAAKGRRIYIEKCCANIKCAVANGSRATSEVETSTALLKPLETVGRGVREQFPCPPHFCSVEVTVFFTSNRSQS
jgi:hypothetical protein